MFNFSMTIFLLIFSNHCFAAAFSVQPLYLDFAKGRKNTSESFEIKIFADEPLTVQTSLYKATQDRSGKLGFQETVDFAEEPVEIQLTKSKHTFRSPGEWICRGKIRFTKKMNATHVYALMVEEQKRDSDGGVGINVRYAVILKIQTSKRKSRISAEITKAEVFDVDGKYFIKSSITNTTEKDFRVESKVNVHDSKKKKVASLPLLTASAWQKSEKESIVFPGSTVDLISPMPNFRTTGDHHLTVYAKINKRKSIRVSGQISVNQKMVDSTVKAQIVTVSPMPRNVRFKKGEFVYYRMKIRNQTADTISFEANPTLEEVGKFEVQIRPARSTVRADKSKNILLKIRNDVDQKLVINDLILKITSSNGKKLNDIPIEIAFEGEG